MVSITEQVYEYTSGAGITILSLLNFIVGRKSTNAAKLMVQILHYTVDKISLYYRNCCCYRKRRNVVGFGQVPWLWVHVLSLVNSQG